MDGDDVRAKPSYPSLAESMTDLSNYEDGYEHDYDDGSLDDPISEHIFNAGVNSQHISQKATGLRAAESLPPSLDRHERFYTGIPVTQADLSCSVHELIKSIGDQVRVKEESQAGSEHPVDTNSVMSSSMNPARAAMIARTAMPRSSNQLHQVAGGGPQRSGMNNIPLGRSHLAAPSQSIDAKPTIAPPMQPTRGIDPAVMAQSRISQHFATLPPPPHVQSQSYTMPQSRTIANTAAPKATNQTEMGQPKKKGKKGKKGSNLSVDTTVDGPRLNNRELKSLNRSREQVIYDEVKAAIRKGVKLACQGRCKPKRYNPQVIQAFNILRPIILSTAVVGGTENEEDLDKDVPASEDDAKPIVPTQD